MHVSALTAAATAIPWSGSASGPAYIPRVASPSKSGFFNNPGSSTLWFSPHYANVAPHGGFNPNAMFSPK
jgi:hypothetical protein